MYFVNDSKALIIIIINRSLKACVIERKVNFVKVHLNLQEVNSYLSGIGVFEKEISMRLNLGKEHEIYGGLLDAFFISNKEEYRKFHYPVEYSLLRAKWIFNYNVVRRPLPIIKYNNLFKTDCDAYVFFSYRLPRCKIEGKVIACIHDLIPLKTEMEDQNIVDSYISSIKDVANRADIIVTVSENSKSDIISYLGVPAEKIRIVNNGVNFNEFNTPISDSVKQLVRRKYNLPEKYILYFGSSRKHKNVESIIKAYASLNKKLRNEYKLVITNSNSLIKETAIKENIDKDVLFVEAISDEHKVAVYQMASLKMLLSLYEGFGIPIIEAMAAKVPVIASNFSSIPEVAGNAAILVNPKDISEITESIEKVLNDENFRENLIKKGIENAKKYTWDSAAHKFSKIIKDILENN